MKYTQDKRLDFGRRIYQGEISRFEAADEYGIGGDTARSYMRIYRAENHLPAKLVESKVHITNEPPCEPLHMDNYESMTKEELIHDRAITKIVQWPKTCSVAFPQVLSGRV